MTRSSGIERTHSYSPVAIAFDLNGGVTTILATASWAPLVQTIVGAFIGAGGAIAGGTFSSWFAQHKERQAIAAALAAEIQCVVEAENWHNARKTLEQGRVPNAEQTSPEI